MSKDTSGFATAQGAAGHRDLPGNAAARGNEAQGLPAQAQRTLFRETTFMPHHVEELLRVGGAARKEDGADDRKAQACALARLVLKAVALATGVGVTVLTFLDEVEPRDALGLLGIGLACLAVSQIAEMDEEEADESPSAHRVASR